MAKAFYAKLAAANLVRNKRMYGPYCVATAMMSGIFFIILNIVFSKSIANLSYGETVQGMFTIGIVVMTLFTVGYMLYINSFLVKRRKKEFGLYGVLGMEKRHVGRVIIWEMLILSVGSLVLGLIGGAVFGNLAFLLLMNILSTAKGSTYVLDPGAAGLTLLVFGVIFVIATLYNLGQVRLANPIDLLKGEQKGEKPTRFALPMTLLGVVLLGLAYTMAIGVRQPAMALLEFWPAVILVIIATWLLFTGGSVFILRVLQRNKRFYYRPSNFITVSGLAHRLKQNAAGLSNICILSTMVMVTVSCCCALFAGQDLILREQHPNDLAFSLSIADKQAQQRITEDTLAQAAQMAEQQNTPLESAYAYRFIDRRVLMMDGALRYPDENGALPYTIDIPLEDFYTYRVVLLDDYNALTGESRTLGEDEALLLLSGPGVHLDSLKAMDGDLRVKDIVYGTVFTNGKNSNSTGRMVIVAADEAVAGRLVRAVGPSVEEVDFSTQIIINVDADQERGYVMTEALREAFREETKQAINATGGSGSYATANIFESRVESYGLYGGLLFLGVFFSLLFLTNTVLILYFKQISEGFEDHERFVILQKVGLSDQEVKSTINRQMLIVFLLPLVVALIHIAAASNMIRMMLGTFMLTDFGLTMLCIAITAAVFVVVYLIVYRVTARTYYRLVKA